MDDSDRLPKRRKLDQEVIDIDANGVIDLDGDESPAANGSTSTTTAVRSNGHAPVAVNLGNLARPAIPPGTEFQLSNGNTARVYGGYIPTPAADVKTESKPSLPADTASNANEAIDLTNAPSPPSAPSPILYDKGKPLCIGSIDTQALILYPSPLMERGNHTEDLVRTRQVRVDTAGEEWLHVKCKWRQRAPEGGMENDSIVVLNSE
jgi:SWI/SNF-related matrix-associated actin-dependent regulator of chromatin subfamily A3